jgi:hypothetical protein
MRRIADGLWTAEGPQQLVPGVELGARMTVVRLADGGLWLHSPIGIGDALRAELEALGPVRHLIAPSLLHHLHLAAAAGTWPEANVWVAPGLAKKCPGVRVRAELSAEAPPEWSGQLDQLVLDGMPRTQEVVFFHRPSRSLILTDFAMNTREVRGAFAGVFWRLNGLHRRFGLSRIGRTMIRDRTAVRAAFERMLAWDPERVLFCHGAPLEGDARAELEGAYAWLRS